MNIVIGRLLTRYLSFETATISAEEPLNRYILNPDNTKNEEMWESTDTTAVVTNTQEISKISMDILISANNLRIADCY